MIYPRFLLTVLALACLAWLGLASPLSTAYAEDAPAAGPVVGPDSDVWTPDPPDGPPTTLTKAFPRNYPTDSLTTTVAAGVPCTVIRVKTGDERVRVTTVVANGFPSGDETFRAMVQRTQPTIAITGTYFSTKSLKPIGDVVVDGELLYKGMMGTALTINEANEMDIRRVRWGRTEDWTGFKTVLGCGPALVLDGEVDVQPGKEGFRDPHIMGSTRRIGVGFTEDNKEMLLVTTLAPVSFDRWAQVMRALGCHEAMNLDAGASMALYYRGSMLMQPSRKLTNLLCVYVDKSAATRPSKKSASNAAEPATR